MFELASFGSAETPAQNQDKLLSDAPAALAAQNGKVQSSDARNSLISDLIAASKACEKAGIDIRDPMIRASLMASGGSALALASRIGPEKTIACIQHFTALAAKHGQYIRHLEKSYMEMKCFSRSLRRALGPAPAGTKEAVAKNANMGGWGVVLALAGLGGAIFYVIKAFSKSGESTKEKLVADMESGMPVKLKDAANKKLIDSLVRVRKDEKTGAMISMYSGTRDGKEFKIECAVGKIPVWSGLEWKCMPTEQAAKIEIAGRLSGFRSGEINAKDAEGVESCCGSLVEIVGRAKAARKRVAPKAAPARRKQNITRIPESAFTPLVIRPGPASPMNETLDPELNAILTQLRYSSPAERANLATVVNRQKPPIWPGSRGVYSY